MKHITALLMVIAIILMLFSCKTTRYITMPEVHTDTVRIAHHQRDSVWLHDSIFVNQYMQGDTVYQYKERWHTLYQARLLHDTAYISRRDTVSVPVPIEKKVPAQLTKFQQMRLWIGNIVLVALAVLAAIWIFRNSKWWVSLLRHRSKS